MNTIITAARATIVTLLLTGIAYPLAMTGAAQVLFADKADGSLLKDPAGKVIGSRLIGQAFTNPGYFQPRPSAAGNGYDATSSGGSNLGSTSMKLRDRVKADVAHLLKENPEAPPLVPAELVTASGSGLDPHLSPAGAAWQIARVARARNLSPDRVRAVVDENVAGRELGLLGEPTVNVLELNLALDRQFGRPAVVPPQAGP